MRKKIVDQNFGGGGLASLLQCVPSEGAELFKRDLRILKLIQ